MDGYLADGMVDDYLGRLAWYVLVSVFGIVIITVLLALFGVEIADVLLKVSEGLNCSIGC